MSRLLRSLWAPRRHPLIRSWPPHAHGHVHIVVLHGGDPSSTHRSWPWAAGPLRATWLASVLAVSFVPQKAVVHHVLHRSSGWNALDGDEPDPVVDGREVLATLCRRDPSAAFVLVGHSMGGRTAVHLASHPRVLGTVLLAPWLPELEPVGGRFDQVTVAIQGSLDTVCRPVDTKAFVAELRLLHRRAGYVEVPGSGHALLARHRRVHKLAAAAVAEVGGLRYRSSLPDDTFVSVVGRS